MPRARCSAIAGREHRVLEPRADPLARDLEHPERRDLADLDPSAIPAERLDDPALDACDLMAISSFMSMKSIMINPPRVPQTKLPDDLVDRLDGWSRYAVCSRSEPGLNRPEFTSIATSASV